MKNGRKNKNNIESVISKTKNNLTFLGNAKSIPVAKHYALKLKAGGKQLIER